MKQTRRIGIGCLFLMTILFFCACAHTSSRTGENGTYGGAAQKDEAPTAAYLDFGDILIPNELKLDAKSSFILRTSGLTAGVLVLKGRVEQSSLIDFFDTNMTRDNWQLVSSFEAPRTLMLYRKDTRWCVINLFENDFSMNVEIWVSPTLDDSGMGLLK